MKLCSPSVPWASRLAWSAGLAALWGTGYLTLGASRPLSRLDPTTALDALIPFAGWAVWPYLLGIVWIVLPAVVIRSAALFARTAAAILIAMIVSFTCFAVAPAGAAGLRAQASDAGLDTLTAMALRTLHAIDPPTNLLPSLHVGLAVVATLALVSERRRWRLGGALMLTAIVASVCLTKQHTVLDVAGGLATGLVAFAVAPQRTPRRISARR